ncbi:catalase-related peroxidase [Alteromonas sp. KC3]|uniref:catalase family peroxidase n=1 Tax=unclassified Alteromonas TaxID=2614992 RepID=UPI001923428D|nr:MULTISPECIES: catalase family peroxidase [unclassified Alteromonas]BCO17905.1 catalase-related peroxidase [Alteromonas sp. KC3]BCO21866.1 catalase-related peroxidase [Alteromonas sp. KC14]
MRTTVTFLLTGFFGLFSSIQTAHAEAVRPVDFINIFEKIAGKHKGVRKNHAKGICAEGSFLPNPAAIDYFDAALFTLKEKPVVFRFSLPGGNPLTSDNSRAPRGLAAQITLSSNVKHNIAALSVPVFAAKDPETFLGLLNASIPGDDDTTKIEAFRKKHPDTQAQAEWLKNNLPPWGYNTSEYFGIHTFFVEHKDGSMIKIRWRLKPRDGLKAIDESELGLNGSNYLEHRLIERLKKSSIDFDWIISLGEENDSEDDPTKQWPVRPTINVGTFKVKSSGGNNCESINFDPNVLSQGFLTSSDPILRMRSPTYAISFGKRINNN